ncbi:MAG: hypothetical protein ACLUHA_05950 [Bacteroides stercoris]
MRAQLPKYLLDYASISHSSYQTAHPCAGTAQKVIDQRSSLVS